MRFEVHEFGFDLPGEGWEEHTVNLFKTASNEPHSMLSIVRAPTTEAPLREMVARAVAELRENPAIEVFGMRASKVGSVPATEVRLICGADSPKGPLVQQILYFSYYGSFMAIGIIAPAAEEETTDTLLQRMATLTRLRRR